MMLPQSLLKRIVVFEGWEDWVRDFPQRLKACEARFRVRVLAPYQGLSYHYVAPALAENGQPYVLKMGVPNREMAAELTALKLFAGPSVVKLLDEDLEMGAWVLERLEPATPLTHLPDDEATRIAAKLMTNLWQDPPSNPSDLDSLPTVEKWSKGLAECRKTFGSHGPIPEVLLSRAEYHFKEFLSTPQQVKLLHGDLHHYNILLSQRGYTIIDPKGLSVKLATNWELFCATLWIFGKETI
ncbi:MAG: aminoglycoside phosphotransferase family protein [Deinococcales bacterium]